MLDWIGVAITVVAVVGYFGMLAAHRFTYETWAFDVPVVFGTVVAIAGGMMEASWTPAVWAPVAAGAWFWVSRAELIIPSAPSEHPNVGDAVPAFEVATIDGGRFTQDDLVDAAPAVLALFRGWWCPASKLQVEGLIEDLSRLDGQGLSVFALSVDSPEDSAWLVEYVGSTVTVLCGANEDVLDAFGSRDDRGVRWYTQRLDGEPAHDIARPSTFVVDGTGTITFVHRSTRVDERSGLAAIGRTAT